MEKRLFMVQGALLAALLAVCSWITLPSVVPFTLQSFGVYVILLTVGGRRGVLAVSVYLLLGAVGVPVFSGFRGGAGVLFGVTGGYLWGFLLMALVFWGLTGRSGGKRRAMWGLLLGQTVCYATGTLWFWWLSGDRLGISLLTCVLPFVVPDLLKGLLAWPLAMRLKKGIKI